MRTAEYLHALQRDYEGIIIESIESKTDFGTTYYEYAIADEEDIHDEIDVIDNDIRKGEFIDDGLAGVLDFDCVFTDTNLDELINFYFWWKYEKD